MQNQSFDMFSKKFKMFFLIGCALALPSCFNLQKQQASLTIVNLLDEPMFNDCSIKGSINVPFTAFERYAQSLDTEKEIVVYCSNYYCTSSAYAWKILDGLGFKKAYAYEGGTAEWHQKGLPTTGPAQMSYLKKVVEKPEEDAEKITTISAEDLFEKMKQHGLV